MRSITLVPHERGNRSPETKQFPVLTWKVVTVTNFAVHNPGDIISNTEYQRMVNQTGVKVIARDKPDR